MTPLCRYKYEYYTGFGITPWI